MLLLGTYYEGPHVRATLAGPPKLGPPFSDLVAPPIFVGPLFLHLLQQKPLNQSPQILLIDIDHWDPPVISNPPPSELSQAAQRRGEVPVVQSAKRGGAGGETGQGRGMSWQWGGPTMPSRPLRADQWEGA